MKLLTGANRAALKAAIRTTAKPSTTKSRTNYLKIMSAFLFLFAGMGVNVHVVADTNTHTPKVQPQITRLGDAKSGKAKSATCVACHGNDGNSNVENFPKIAGQSEQYLYKQLKDMKKPDTDPTARPVPEMTGILVNLTDQDLRDLSTYYADQQITLEGVDPDWLALGEKIYRSGNKESKVAACTSCHGNQGKGLPEAGIPALGGQHAAYTVAQLRAFRAAGREDLNAPKYRRNDGDTMMMRNAVKGLTDKEIEAVASYVSGLH